MYFKKIKEQFFIMGSILLILFLLQTNAASAVTTGEVRVGNKVIFRFVSTPGENPIERAEVVQRRIDALMDSGLGSHQITVKEEAGTFSIMWGTETITTIDAFQAKANKTTPKALAEVWAKNFREALRDNAFFLVPAHITIPINGSGIVKAGGIAGGEIVKDYDAGNVNVSIDQNSGEIKIIGMGIGSSKVVLARGGMKAAVNVRILDLPAIIPDKIEAEVSGDPAPKDILQYAAVNACRSSIRVKSGAVMEIGGGVRVERKLDKGMSAMAHVPVTIKGRDYYTINKEIPVIIQNAAEGFDDIQKLMVSDRPEGIHEDGILFHGKFNKDTPTRLLYYHQNINPKPRRLWVELKNDSNKPVSVLVSGAMGGPSRWGVTVGHMAAMRFLEITQKGIGYTIQIPPKQTVNLIDIQIAHEQVLCGYFHLKMRKGEEVDVYVKNSGDLDGDTASMDLPLIIQPFDPFKIHPKGIFKPANLDEELEFTLGDEDEEELSMVVGSAPWLIDAVTGEPNNGNYGVFYRFNVTLNNPTDEVKRVGFYLKPRGILARGSFIIDNKIMETGLIRRPAKTIFAVVDINPNSSKTISIVTTPEGGSYYPVEIVLSPVDRNVGSSNK